LAAGEKAPGRRLPALLLMAGTVLALGAYQAYRIFDTPTPPMQAVGESLGGPAQQQPSVAAQPESSVPASASPSPTAAPTAAPIGAAGPAAASDPAPAPAKPGKGASLIDPLAVGAIAPHVNSMAALQSGAQFASVKDLAEKGDPTSQYDMGVRSFEGRGVARDPLAAIQWFEKAAAQGLAQAQYRLGAIYEKGSGAPRDAYKARDWYEKSALLGNIRAMHNLAVIEAEGVDGKPDYASAAQWFHRAADYGVRDSQYNLAILYARGMGVAQNMSMSYVWFALAAKQGDEDAAKKRDEIAGRLDAATLEGAKKQVEDFHARVAPPSANGNPAASVGPAANGFSQPGAKPAAAKATL
jgi:localization factor PodJL